MEVDVSSRGGLWFSLLMGNQSACLGMRVDNFLGGAELTVFRLVRPLNTTRGWLVEA